MLPKLLASSAQETGALRNVLGKKKNKQKNQGMKVEEKSMLIVENFRKCTKYLYRCCCQRIVSLCALLHTFYHLFVTITITYWNMTKSVTCFIQGLAGFWHFSVARKSVTYSLPTMYRGFCACHSIHTINIAYFFIYSVMRIDPPLLML